MSGLDKMVQDFSAFIHEHSSGWAPDDKSGELGDSVWICLKGEEVYVGTSDGFAKKVGAIHPRGRWRRHGRVTKPIFLAHRHSSNNKVEEAIRAKTEWVLSNWLSLQCEAKRLSESIDETSAYVNDICGKIK